MSARHESQPAEKNSQRARAPRAVAVTSVQLMKATRCKQSSNTRAYVASAAPVAESILVATDAVTTEIAAAEQPRVNVSKCRFSLHSLQQANRLNHWRNLRVHIATRTTEHLAPWRGHHTLQIRKNKGVKPRQGCKAEPSLSYSSAVVARITSNKNAAAVNHALVITICIETRESQGWRSADDGLRMKHALFGLISTAKRY